ncbi:MAG TPA: serine/threonine-protein kinase [Labilithrix sp.]|nr:serine/threonine-protein kinase [Labilithrix sp.]
MTSQHKVGQGRIGTVLAGAWRIERRVGAGGMATVYAARHARNGGRVAVKVLHPDSSRDAELVRRFLREGYLANTLSHPGVVRVYDDGVTDDGCAYLIMDLLDGETLDERRLARGGRLPVDEALSVVRSVLHILDAAHERGIAHRDVKPENVFLTSDGGVRLLDFGVAGMARSPSSSLRTGTGVGWGTPHFMAPEQLTGASPCGRRVDVWAVGVMFYRLLTGEHLFEVRTLTELMLAHQARRTTLHELLPGLAPGLTRVFEQALRYDAAERWADARAMTAALEETESASSRFSTTLALATVPRIAIERPRVVVAPPAPLPQPASPAPRGPAAPAAFDRRRAVLGLLALSIATFLTSAVYSVRAGAESAITTNVSR